MKALFFVFAVFAGVAFIRADDRTGDLQRSAGVWDLVSVTVDGNKLPPARLRGLTITLPAMPM